ncbi:MAG: T9SS type A sorting domain-containing protein [Bacteroidetes bacterium]|nr:T9SS type A sorting domain-containing protein [Bacteroidota bacterium]
MGNNDILILKLDTDGNYVWAKSIGGTGDDQAVEIASDNSDNVYVTGLYTATVDFDPSAGTTNLTSAGKTDIFILKLDASGNLSWVNSTGGTSWDGARTLTADAAGNTYASGYYAGTADFDPTAGVSNLVSKGSYDFYIQKFDTNGNSVWVKPFGDTGDDCGLGMALDASGNIVLTGFYFNTVDFDPNAGTTNLTSVGNADIQVMKLDTAGNLIWAKSVGGTSADHGNGIATDSDNNIYVTGHYQGTVDFDPGSGISELTSNGNRDVFIQKLDSAGNFVWAGSIGGTLVDVGNFVAVDDADNVFIVGMYRNVVDFDPGTNNTSLTSLGGADAFVLKLDLSTVNVAEHVLGKAGSVSPNPNNGDFQINLPENPGEVVINVFTLDGRLIKSQIENNNNTVTLNIEGANGIYVVEVVSDSGRETFKVLKE